MKQKLNTKHIIGIVLLVFVVANLSGYEFSVTGQKDPFRIYYNGVFVSDKLTPNECFNFEPGRYSECAMFDNECYCLKRKSNKPILFSVFTDYGLDEDCIKASYEFCSATRNVQYECGSHKVCDTCYETEQICDDKRVYSGYCYDKGFGGSSADYNSICDFSDLRDYWESQGKYLDDERCDLKESTFNYNTQTWVNPTTYGIQEGTDWSCDALEKKNQYYVYKVCRDVQSSYECNCHYEPEMCDREECIQYDTKVVDVYDLPNNAQNVVCTEYQQETECNSGETKTEYCEDGTLVNSAICENNIWNIIPNYCAGHDDPYDPDDPGDNDNDEISLMSIVLIVSGIVIFLVVMFSILNKKRR